MPIHVVTFNFQDVFKFKFQFNGFARPARIDVSDSEHEPPPQPSGSAFEIPAAWDLSDDGEDPPDPPDLPDLPDPADPPEDRAAVAAPEPSPEPHQQLPEFTPHVRTDGHRTICAVLLPALVTVLRDPALRNKTPREHVRRACQRHLLSIWILKCVC